MDKSKKQGTKKGSSAEGGLLYLLKPYTKIIGLMVFFTVLANAFNLAVPKIIASAINDYSDGSFVLSNLIYEFSLVAVLIFIFTYVQSLFQVYASERVARDLRAKLIGKISLQSYSYVEGVTSSKLLTNLTADVESIKSFVWQAIASIVASVFLIIGSAVLLLIINFKLALFVLSIVPLIAFIFYYIFGKVKSLFKKSQEAIDWLNKVINESILGAGIIRILNSEKYQYDKFLDANTEAKRVSLRILSMFSMLIPAITFCTSIATLIILIYGSKLVIQGNMSIGDFTAFNSYLLILIFPIMIIGFMSTVIAQASASYGRILEVLNSPGVENLNGEEKTLSGDLEVKNLNVQYGEKNILKNISFSVKPKSRTAIIGPTAAGKSQLLYVLTGLLKPTSGEVLYDKINIDSFDNQSLYSQIGFVFQDSVMFNLSIRENIAFSNTVDDESLSKAIKTAELNDFIKALPNGIDTVISERGTTLSGGQKQRIMLARALAINPKILLLDDFTSRVDTETERKILDNISKNYSDLTLISVTQKISSVEKYDKIIVLMEGEKLAEGTHEELMKTSSEYVQIYESQKSTNQYEIQSK